MKSPTVAAALAAAIVATTPVLAMNLPGIPGSPLELTLEIHSVIDNGGSPAYYAWPFIREQFDTGIPIEVSSPGGVFQGHANLPDFIASSQIFYDFNDFVAQLGSSPWLIRFDSWSDWYFTVNADQLRPADFPPVSITNPQPNGTISSGGTFTWGGPSSWASLDVANFNDSASLPPTATDWTPASVGALGSQNIFFVDYYSSPIDPDPTLNNLVTVTPPDNGSGPLPNGWVASVVLSTGASSYYTVVPEPTAVAVVASLGLVGFAAVRRKLMA